MTALPKEQLDFISETIGGLLDRIGISYSLEPQEGGEEIWFCVKTADAPLLVGENGRHLAAFSAVLRRIVEKKFPEPVRFVVDVNDYHRKRTEELKDMARMHAQRVRYFKKEVEMHPMNAYERRVVHTVLQEYPDIATESVGEGMERRVVVKPVSL